MSANPFRPAQKETYEQQLDLSAPKQKSVEETDELVDVGLSSSHATGVEQDQQPKFLESSGSSLLTSGTLGPKVAAPSATNTSVPPQGNSNAPSGIFASVCAWLSVEYYQPYFDVSTATVMERMKLAIMPHKSDLFATTSESQPDLYGAVWISLTLVFLIGASSNLNSFFVKSLAQEPWQGDYRILTFASTMVSIYTIVVPFLLWAASLYTGVDPRPTLVKLIGIYGYTLVLFIPVSLLCVIPSGAFQWIIVLLAAGVSGTVLARNLYTAFGTSYSALSQTDAEAQLATEENPTTSRTKTSVLLITGAAVLHAVFSLMLKLFFFQGGELSSTITDNSDSKGR